MVYVGKVKKIISVFVVITFHEVSTISDHPILLIISFDGFRHSYFDKSVTPYMEDLRENGTFTEFLYNVFVTKTFPNHHSIATGLYPEIHGVLDKQVFDTRVNKIYEEGYELWHYDESVTPIWTLNELGGPGRHSGVMMWPGGNYAYQNTSTTFSVPFNTSISWEERLDIVLKWILHPVTPANLVMMYIEDPDDTSHRFGSESEQVLEVLRNLDQFVLHLNDRLKLMNLSSIVNVFYLSDHGMSSFTRDVVINVSDYLKPFQMQMISSSPVWSLFPLEDEENRIFEILKNASQYSNFTVYRRDEIPERWHYKHSFRSPPLLLVADIGYAFDDVLQFEQLKNPSTYADHLSKGHTSRAFGIHGYDNSLSSMHPMFFCIGPQIKSFNFIPPFYTVDLYILFSTMLGLVSPPTNGSVEVLDNILVSQSSLWVKIATSTAVIMTVILSVICCSGIVCTCISHTTNNGTNRYGELMEELTDEYIDENFLNGTQTEELEMQGLLSGSSDGEVSS